MFAGKKAILFDMDGTLIDSIGLWNLADETLIRRIRTDGRDGTGDVQAFRDGVLREKRQEPNPYRAYCDCLREKYGARETAEEIHRIRYDIAGALLRERIDYKPGAPELLRRLRERGFRLAVVSATARSNMEIYRRENRNIREKAPIDSFFELVLTREDSPAMKPDPAVYRLALERLGLRAEDCVAFEDSLVGVEAAVGAGIDTVSVYDRYSEAEQEDIRRLSFRHIRDFRELLCEI